MYVLGVPVKKNVSELTPYATVTHLEPYGWEITRGGQSWTLKGGYAQFSQMSNGTVKCAAKEPYYEEV